MGDAKIEILLVKYFNEVKTRNRIQGKISPFSESDNIDIQQQNNIYSKSISINLKPEITKTQFTQNLSKTLINFDKVEKKPLFSNVNHDNQCQQTNKKLDAESL